MMLDIEYLESISKLKLEDNEKLLFEKEISNIIEFISEIDKVEIPEETENFQVITLSELREDVPETNFSREDILLNASKQNDGCFVTPLVVD